MAEVSEFPPAAQALIDEASNPATPTERLEQMQRIWHNFDGYLTEALGGLLVAGATAIHRLSGRIESAVLSNPNAPRHMLLDLVRSPHYSAVVVQNPMLPLLLLVDPPSEQEAGYLGEAMAVLMQKAAPLELWWPAMTAWEAKRRVKSKLAAARSILSNRGEKYLHRYLVDASIALRLPRLGGMARALVELDEQRALAQHTVSARPYVPVVGTELWKALGGVEE